MVEEALSNGGQILTELSIQERSLKMALQKAIELVKDVEEEEYRKAAFPILLQALINSGATPPVAHNPLPETVVTEEPNLLHFPLNLSVNEFMLKVKPNSHAVRFACAAYYLTGANGRAEVTMADILDIYAKLRTPKPQNPADIVNQCIRKGHLVDAPASPDRPKGWILTATGRQFVDQLLNGGPSNALLDEPMAVEFLSSASRAPKTKAVKGGSRAKRRGTTGRRTVSHQSA